MAQSSSRIAKNMTTSVKTGSLPKGWPSDVTYIHQPSYSKSITPEIHAALHTGPAALSSEEKRRLTTGPQQSVRITQISQPSHPAHGQHGLFAARNLPPSSLIIVYLGFVHTQAEADPISDYDLSLDRELGVGVDANKVGNEARFINDYRGTSSNGPNAEFKDFRIDLGNSRCEKRIGVFVLPAGKSGKRSKGISKGEEILVSYGKGFWTERSKDSGIQS